MTRELPVLRPCPDCGVLLQGGRGKHRLAHHGCVPSNTVAGAKRKILAILVARAEDAQPRDLVGLLEVIREFERDEGGGEGGDGKGDLLGWLARE